MLEGTLHCVSLIGMHEEFLGVQTGAKNEEMFFFEPPGQSLLVSVPWNLFSLFSFFLYMTDIMTNRFVYFSLYSPWWRVTISLTLFVC